MKKGRIGSRGSPEEGYNSAWKVREGFLQVVMALEAHRRISQKRGVAGKRVPDGWIACAKRKC